MNLIIIAMKYRFYLISVIQNRGLVLAVSVLALAFWDTVLLWCAFFYYAVKLVTIYDVIDTSAVYNVSETLNGPASELMVDNKLKFS